MTKTTLETAYIKLTSYVKRRSAYETFTANALRKQLTTVRGLKTTQFPGLISKAVRAGLIQRTGETTSDRPNHNSGRVGVYSRGYASY
jgi:hypothetical protein